MNRRRVLQIGAGALATCVPVGGASGLDTGGGSKGTELNRVATTGTRQGMGGDSFEPVGDIDITGATDAAVHGDDKIVFVAGESGFAVVDIEDPSDPQQIVDMREITAPDGRTLQQIWDLWPWRDRLVVGGPAQRNTESAWGFALFDISEPVDPIQVAFYETPDHFVHNTFFDDGIVYLTGSGLEEQPLVMVDVADDEPVEINRWSITDHDPGFLSVPRGNRTIHDIYVHENVAYLSYWDAGTWLVDVSDPADPVVCSRVGEYDLADLQSTRAEDSRVEALTLPGNAHYATVNDDATLLVVGKEAWEINDDGERRGGPGGVILYDIEDRTAPEKLAEIDAPESYDQTQNGWFTTAHNCDIRDDRLYTSWYFGGVKIHDVSDPTAPRELAWWREPAEASFWTAQSAGPHVVAASSNLRKKLGTDINETRAALYVFPDSAGDQPNPPSLKDPPGQNGRADDSAKGVVGSGENDESADDAPDESNETVNADSDGRGFGLLTGLASLTGLSVLLGRNRNRSSK